MITEKNSVKNKREFEKQGITSNEYARVHYHINKNNKKTGNCLHCKNVKITEWALIKGMKYTTEISNYMELCVSCHRKYDTSDYQRKTMSKNSKDYHKSNPLVVSKRQTGKFGSLHQTSKKIIQLDMNGNIVKHWGSTSEASRFLGISASGIANCLTKISNSSAGYKWIYEK